MKQKLLASAMALAMVLSLTPVTALAAEGDTLPQVADMNIVYDGSNIEKDNVNGSLVFTATGDTQVVDYTATVSLSDGAVFTPTTHNAGDLYVEAATSNEVTLKFDIMVGPVDLKDDQFALILESTDGTTWTGGFENASDLTLDMLAQVGAQERDIEDIAAFVGQVEGVKNGVTLRELRPGECKLSLRTDPGDLNASAVCALLGGGGHAAAAGATIPGTMEQARAAVLAAIERVRQG